MNVSDHPTNFLSPAEMEDLAAAVEQLCAASAPDDTFALAGLIAAERQKIPELFSERYCTAGELLFREGDVGDSMYIILTGKVAVVKGDLGAPVLLGCRWSGETIGEMAVLEAQPRSASVVAMQPLQLLGIDRRNFVKLLRESPSFSLGLMQMLSARLRQTSEIVQRETLDKIRDALTGLYNRRYLEDVLPRELTQTARNADPLSLILMDIDRFKAVNDTYGHATGDRVLQALGELLCHQVRRGDVACRYGGEEFLVILPATPLEVARRRAEDLRQAYAEMRVEHQGHTLQGSLSLGVATYPIHGETAESLLAAADAALYGAKRQGRNRVVVADSSPS